MFNDERLKSNWNIQNRREFVVEPPKMKSMNYDENLPPLSLRMIKK